MADIVHSDGIEIIEKESAFKKRVRTYTYKNIDYIDLTLFLKEARRLFIKHTKILLNEMPNLKSNMIMEVKFLRNLPVQAENPDAETEQIATFYFQSKIQSIDLATKLKRWFKTNVIDEMSSKVDELQESGSGWALHEIVGLDVNFNKFVRFGGSSYIPTPKSIKSKRAVVNVKNYDNQCFKWAILSALHPAKKNTERLSNYTDYENELDFEGIEFPIKLTDIDMFEQLNTSISVNVYILNKEFSKFNKKIETVVVPVRLTEQVKERHVHLLMLSTATKEDDDGFYSSYKIPKHNLNEIIDDASRQHYVWIKNLSCLIQSQVNAVNRAKKYICDRCLHYFYSEEKLKKHLTICESLNETRVTLPDEKHKWVRFNNHKNKVVNPFIIYADIESLLVPVDENADIKNKAQEKLPKGAVQKHVPNSIGYYLHARNHPELSHYDSFTGENCIQQFIDKLKEVMERKIWPVIHKNVTMQFTDEMEKEFMSADVCHICSLPFSEEEYKVRDHCHMTGTYRGTAHSDCNLKHQISKAVPVVFHNLDYDSHFLIEELAANFRGALSIIPKNSEHYISFTKDMDFLTAGEGHAGYREKARLRFIDSYRFLQCSLAKLAETLPMDKLNITRAQWAELNEDELKLLTKKGVYPYSYMNSWEKLKETQLPTINSFYDELNECHITLADYEHAKTVWNTFDIRTLQEYTEIYLKTDVLLLADIFENFRDNCIRIYGLDPSHYYTLPGYSWDCMLKHTQVEIELLTDIDKLLFVERGMRGGICQCSHRHITANNKYLKNYDPAKESNYLLYLDVNNLYGWAMSQHLPISHFAWCEDINLNDVDKVAEKIMTTSDTADTGYFLEVDLSYGQELHMKHNDFAFCCEHKTTGGSKEKKLLLTLTEKKNYVIHYRMLKQALKHGLKLKKVHKILQFHQTAWLNEYIMLNTIERTKSKTEFEKNLYKLMNNAVFGKCLENIRNRREIKLVTYWKGRYGLESYVSKPNFKRNVIFNENLVACELGKANVYMTKPMIVGTSILEISKCKMYEFHYDFIQKIFGYERCKIAYTDTDAFLYNFLCDDIYEFIREHPDKFDTSDFAENNEYGIQRLNKKVVGLMKDEYSGVVIKEFIGLRAKMYAIKSANNKILKKGKGVKKSVLNRKISFADYKKSITENCTITERQNQMKSSMHKVYNITTNEKKVLDPFDDKRFIVPNSHSTLAWGHYKINTYKNAIN